MVWQYLGPNPTYREQEPFTDIQPTEANPSVTTTPTGDPVEQPVEAEAASGHGVVENAPTDTEQHDDVDADMTDIASSLSDDDNGEPNFAARHAAEQAAEAARFAAEQKKAKAAKRKSLDTLKSVVGPAYNVARTISFKGPNNTDIFGVSALERLLRNFGNNRQSLQNVPNWATEWQEKAAMMFDLPASFVLTDKFNNSAEITGWLKLSALYGKPSASATELLEKTVQRHLHLRDSRLSAGSSPFRLTSGSGNTPSSQNILAGLLYIFGESVHLGVDRCEKCENGGGPFPSCVSSGDLLKGACASCIYNNEGARCSFRKEKSATKSSGSATRTTKSTTALKATASSKSAPIGLSPSKKRAVFDSPSDSEPQNLSSKRARTSHIVVDSDDGSVVEMRTLRKAGPGPVLPSGSIFRSRDKRTASRSVVPIHAPIQASKSSLRAVQPTDVLPGIAHQLKEAYGLPDRALRKFGSIFVGLGNALLDLSKEEEDY